jgi:hypothetical protein
MASCLSQCSPNRVARWFVFKPKIPIWLNFGGSCYGKILVYFMNIWSILRSLEIFYGHLVYFVVIWYIFRHFGILDPEKSGNPESKSLRQQLFPTHSRWVRCYKKPELRSKLSINRTVKQFLMFNSLL